MNSSSNKSSVSDCNCISQKANNDDKHSIDVPLTWCGDILDRQLQQTYAQLSHDGVHGDNDNDLSLLNNYNFSIPTTINSIYFWCSIWYSIGSITIIFAIVCFSFVDFEPLLLSSSSSLSLVEAAMSSLTSIFRDRHYLICFQLLLMIFSLAIIGAQVLMAGLLCLSHAVKCFHGLTAAKTISSFQSSSKYSDVHNFIPDQNNISTPTPCIVYDPKLTPSQMFIHVFPQSPFFVSKISPQLCILLPSLQSCLSMALYVLSLLISLLYDCLMSPLSVLLMFLPQSWLSMVSSNISHQQYISSAFRYVYCVSINIICIIFRYSFPFVVSSLQLVIICSFLSPMLPLLICTAKRCSTHNICQSTDAISSDHWLLSYLTQLYFTYPMHYLIFYSILLLGFPILMTLSRFDGIVNRRVMPHSEPSSLQSISSIPSFMCLSSPEFLSLFRDYTSCHLSISYLYMILVMTVFMLVYVDYCHIVLSSPNVLPCISRSVTLPSLSFASSSAFSSMSMKRVITIQIITCFWLCLSLICKKYQSIHYFLLLYYSSKPINTNQKDNEKSTSLDENEIRLQLDQMRHLIANVAHDLKTVSVLCILS